MAYLEFTWDAGKARQNLRKHRVTFEEAETVFFDEFARLIPDPDHSDDEDRFILLGLSSRFRLLAVVHTYRNDDLEIRIISARKAIRQEKQEYEELLP